MKSLEADTLAPSRCVAAHDLVADDDADMQRIDQHVVRRAFHRHRLGQRHLRGAADRGRRAVGARRLGADIEHADDAAPFARLHLRHQDAAEADLREQLEVEIGLPLRVGDRLRRAAGRLAGIVDEDVDLAEFRYCIASQAASIGAAFDTSQLIASTLVPLARPSPGLRPWRR